MNPSDEPALSTLLISAIAADPQVHSGDLCFRGTRVPAATLLGYLDDGLGVEEFRHGYPTVAEWQIQAVLAAPLETTLRVAVANLMAYTQPSAEEWIDVLLAIEDLREAGHSVPPDVLAELRKRGYDE